MIEILALRARTLRTKDFRDVECTVLRKRLGKPERSENPELREDLALDVV